MPILGLIVEDAGAGGVVAIVSEYGGEPSLDSWNAQAGPIEPLEIARLVLALAEALHYAAKKGVVHALLTPERIRIGAGGDPRIADLGLTLLGCRPVLSSSGGRGWAFTAPELRKGNASPATEQADIFSWGVVLHWLLTGERQGDDSVADSGKRRTGAPSRSREPFWKAAGSGRTELTMDDPQVPVELQTVCARAIEPDSSARYASWAKLLADLRKLPGTK